VGILVAAFLLTVGIMGEQRVLARRRLALYQILQELRPGITRTEVEAVLSRHHAWHIDRFANSADRLTLVTSLGGGRSCILTLRFSDERLNSARIRGENGPGDVFPDAPADLASPVKEGS